MGQPNDLNAAAMVAAAATATATATASVVALRERNDQYGQVGGSTAAATSRPYRVFDNVFKDGSSGPAWGTSFGRWDLT